jgi:hypothetical protein
MTATNLCDYLSDILQQVVFDVVKDGVEERCTNAFESFLDPVLKM